MMSENARTVSQKVKQAIDSSLSHLVEGSLYSHSEKPSLKRRFPFPAVLAVEERTISPRERLSFTLRETRLCCEMDASLQIVAEPNLLTFFSAE
jgi:hypothetical protein